jgi:hypothetical protein
MFTKNVYALGLSFFVGFATYDVCNVIRIEREIRHCYDGYHIINTEIPELSLCPFETEIQLTQDHTLISRNGLPICFDSDENIACTGLSENNHPDCSVLHFSFSHDLRQYALCNAENTKCIALGEYDNVILTEKPLYTWMLESNRSENYCENKRNILLRQMEFYLLMLCLNILGVWCCCAFSVLITERKNKKSLPKGSLESSLLPQEETVDIV